MAIFLTVVSPEVCGYGSKKRHEISEKQNKVIGTRSKDHGLEEVRGKRIIDDKLEDDDEKENEVEFFSPQ